MQIPCMLRLHVLISRQEGMDGIFTEVVVSFHTEYLVFSFTNTEHI